MNTRLAGLMLFAVSAPAFAAGPEQGKFSMSLFGGADTPISGDVHDGAVAPVPDLGPLNPDLAGVYGVNELDYRSSVTANATINWFDAGSGLTLDNAGNRSPADCW